MPKPKKSVRRPKNSASVRYPKHRAEQINPSAELGAGPLAGILLKDAPSDSSLPLVGSSRCDDRASEERSAQRADPTSQPSTLNLFYSAPGVWLYHNNCLEVLDAIAARHPEGRFDMIFADPPYFLSNGGITCHAGKMVSVHKGDWDQSRGWEWNHEFNTEWLRRCQRVLKPNGTLWVTGTYHVIFSVGFALQQLGFKILNDIAWEKPNPPPNLSCRYFTHSTETILWAAKNEKSKHLFNYAAMRAVTGKQMKTVWRKDEFAAGPRSDSEVGSSRCDDRSSLSPRDSGAGRESERGASELPDSHSQPSTPNHQLSPIWTMTAPGTSEKSHGKHPTQKPVALVERCILASTKEGDLVLDPFLGGGTTAVACIRLRRGFVGVELDLTHLSLATHRADAEIITLWLRHFRVRITINAHGRDGFHSVPNISPSEGPARMPSLAGAGEGGANAPGEGCRGEIKLCREGEPRHQKNDLDLFSNLIDRSDPMSDKPEPQSERIFHETKFVFLSCAVVTSASVVHTTVDISLTEAWAHAPTGKKRETTHIVRCETEILRVKGDRRSREEEILG